MFFSGEILEEVSNLSCNVTGGTGGSSQGVSGKYRGGNGGTGKYLFGEIKEGTVVVKK